MQSPCIRQCTLVDKVCQGCKRTLDEIVNWTSYTDKQRQQITEESKTR